MMFGVLEDRWQAEGSVQPLGEPWGVNPCLTKTPGAGQADRHLLPPGLRTKTEHQPPNPTPAHMVAAALQS